MEVRAGNLRRIIKDILGVHANEFYKQPFIKSLKSPPLSRLKRILKKVYKKFFKSDKEIEIKPTYIPVENFIQAIENMILSGIFDKNDKNNFKEALKNLIEGNGKHRMCIFPETKSSEFENAIAYFLYKSSNIEEFRCDLSNWYENARVRAQGWYKRKAQVWLFIFGFFLAVSLNIDIVKITETLYANHFLRDAIVEEAKIFWNQTISEQSKNSTYSKEEKIVDTKSNNIQIGKNKRDLIAELNSYLDIVPIGWNKTSFLTIILTTIKSPEKILGFFLTAIGISFGASFWFDLLGKLINLRSTGPKPERIKEEKSHLSR